MEGLAGMLRSSVGVQLEVMLDHPGVDVCEAGLDSNRNPQISRGEQRVQLRVVSIAVFRASIAEAMVESWCFKGR